MKTVTKSDISNNISAKIGLSSSMCEDVINKILDIIIEFAEKGENVHIKNFGSFNFHSKKSRPGRDILKNKTVMIEEKKVHRFSSARSFRKAINS